VWLVAPVASVNGAGAGLRLIALNVPQLDEN